ncbi:MAG: hypothetical protein LBE56_10380 [Tannerella sp.]|jgi:hypothetical protein|nr:hypothetical protein [Tannerella sp.]
MNTISVTVDQPKQARMLAEWLKNIRFVKEVHIQVDKPSAGNAKEIMDAFNAIKSKQMFPNITDPVAYQRMLRDEWE